MSDQELEEIREMRDKLETAINKAKTGLQVQDPRHCKQLLREICHLTAEYVTK